MARSTKLKAPPTSSSAARSGKRKSRGQPQPSPPPAASPTPSETASVGPQSSAEEEQPAQASSSKRKKSRAASEPAEEEEEEEEEETGELCPSPSPRPRPGLDPSPSHLLLFPPPQKTKSDKPLLDWSFDASEEGMEDDIPVFEEMMKAGRNKVLVIELTELYKRRYGDDDSGPASSSSVEVTPAKKAAGKDRSRTDLDIEKQQKITSTMQVLLSETACKDEACSGQNCLIGSGGAHTQLTPQMQRQMVETYLTAQARGDASAKLLTPLNTSLFNSTPISRAVAKAKAAPAPTSASSSDITNLLLASLVPSFRQNIPNPPPSPPRPAAAAAARLPVTDIRAFTMLTDLAPSVEAELIKLGVTTTEGFEHYSIFTLKLTRDNLDLLYEHALALVQAVDRWKRML